MIYRVVHNLALAAALVVLAVSLWHDWSLMTTAKRMVISYLGFFFFGGLMALSIRLVGTCEAPPSEDENGTE